VDASESMAAQERMAMAKGAALAVLRTAYLRRDRVAVVVFEGESARVLLAPTPSIDQARQRLRRLPIGGATPLAAGLRTAWQVIASERQREPQIAATLVLLSDGRANVPLVPRADPRTEVLALANRIRADGVFSLVVDTEALYPTQPELMSLAEHLGGRILRLGRGGASALAAAVRRA
jgi:magnesium chelatase subunit D